MIVYPLENNSDLLHTCYSAKQLEERGNAITHIVHKRGHKTLCGVHVKKDTLLHGYSDWLFDVWSMDDDNLGVDNIGCMKCKKSKNLIDI